MTVQPTKAPRTTGQPTRSPRTTGQPSPPARRSRRATARLAALFLLVGLLSACGGDGLTTALVPSQHRATPGHDSPGAAVAGFFTAAAQKDQGTACGFVPPEEKATCTKVSGLGASLPPGGLLLGDTSRHGPIALVVLLGHLCLKSSGKQSCLTNTDLRAGLPSANLTFVNAVRRALTKANDPATLCLKLKGRWYADMFA